MIAKNWLRCATAALAAAGAGVAAAGADVTYTFDELAVNTAVTTQYYGVTFSVQPQSCSGSPTLYMRIKVPTGGTSSGTRALQIDQGCPDFSSDYLRMVFAQPQSKVTFTVGDYATTYTVRSYSTTSGAGLIDSENVVLEGTDFVGVHRMVTVASGAGNIRRIEVQTPVGLFETIDDLSFNADPTPPEAAITSPGQLECVCGAVTVFGTARDPDGPYLNRTLEYSSSPAGPWTLISSSNTEVSGGVLGSWATGALSEGYYYLRLTSTNAVNDSVSVVSICWVSRNFDTVSFSLPPVIGGIGIPDGTVFDSWCGAAQYTVDYRPSGGPTWFPVNPAAPTYAGTRVNENLAAWNTQSPAAPDGTYSLRVAAQNLCPQVNAMTVTTIVDNTPPIALITSPQRCTTLGAPASVQVLGTASDANIEGWSLWYTGGDAAGWQLINTGGRSIVNGVLGAWNTAGLRPCAYTLRLVVTDQAIRNNDAAVHNQGEYTVSVDLGCGGDFNLSGDVSVYDIFDFLAAYFAGCP